MCTGRSRLWTDPSKYVRYLHDSFGIRNPNNLQAAGMETVIQILCPEVRLG